MNNEKVLTLIDTMQIQNYIFGTNQLKEIAGASYLVKYVTEELVLNTLDTLNYKGNRNWDDAGEIEKVSIFDNDNHYEIIFLGGGNASIIFKDEDAAKKFTSAWSKKVLETAPGLNAAVSHTSFPEGQLLNKYKEAAFELAQNKTKKNTAVRFECLPVFERCASTGMRCTDRSKDKKNDKDNKYISDIAAQKTECNEKSIKDIEQKFRLKEKGGKIPLDLEDMGQKKGFNFIATVHIDGNNIGRKFLNKISNNMLDKDYIIETRKFSKYLEDVNIQSAKNTMDKIICRFRLTEEGYYPFRPVIYGGDDLTIICRGDIGLKFAEIYAAELQQISKKPEYSKYFGDQGLSCCAGVSITHTNYPFSQAYRLSEELISNAKNISKKIYPGKEVSAVDWHINMSSYLNDLDKIRKTQYERRNIVEDKKENIRLTLKPYYFNNSDDFCSFTKFRNALLRLNLIPQSKYKDIVKIISSSDMLMQQYLDIEADKYKKYYNKISDIFNLNRDCIYFEKNGIKSSPLLDLIETVKFYPFKDSELMEVINDRD